MENGISLLPGMIRPAFGKHCRRNYASCTFRDTEPPLSAAPFCRPMKRQTLGVVSPINVLPKTCVHHRVCTRTLPKLETTTGVKPPPNSEPPPTQTCRQYQGRLQKPEPPPIPRPPPKFELLPNTEITTKFEPTANLEMTAETRTNAKFQTQTRRQYLNRHQI